MTKVVPKETMMRIAHAPKGVFAFKTDARNQFYPYELLNYSPTPTIIVPLRRTATGMHTLLKQHGYDLNNVHYIDILAKHIKSPLEQKNTTYIQHINLSDLSEAIQEKVKALGSSPKTVIIDDAHILIPHHGELKTRRFLDNLTSTLHNSFTKTVVLAEHQRLPKEVSKFLFTHASDVIEIPA